MRSRAAIFRWLLVLGFATGAGAALPAELVLAVHPYLPRHEIVSRFTPLADALGRAVGQPMRVAVGADYAEHVNAIGRDTVDIAYMGPVPYVRLVARYGHKPLLARQVVAGEPVLRGVIVVRGDSAIRTLADLKGKRFAFGDPDSTMSHVVPQRMLERAGVPLTSLGGYQFIGAHKNVALGVLAGDFDAGAVKEEVYQELAPRGLRLLAQSPPVADHLFVASAKLAPGSVEILRRALLSLHQSSEGKAILARIHPDLEAFVPAADADYDGLRALIGTAAPARTR